MYSAFLAAFVMAVALVPGNAEAVTHAEMQEVLKIARGVAAVQPFLPNAKYVAYAIAIHKASQRFNIHPALLISIAQQESGFRADLPEGPAGEIGICQILKSWLNHTGLKREFGKLSIRDLKKPSISFQIAAWILKDLEQRVDTGSLPFWSFYNSPNFKHRLTYFQRVSTKIAALRNKAPEIYSDSLMMPAGGRGLASLKPGYMPVASRSATHSRGKMAKNPIATSRMPRLALHRQKTNSGSGPQESLLRMAGFGFESDNVQD
jgi:hypothetical protein